MRVAWWWLDVYFVAGLIAGEIIERREQRRERCRELHPSNYTPDMCNHCHRSP